MALIETTSGVLINATEMHAPSLLYPVISLINKLFILIGGFIGVFVLSIIYRVWEKKRLSNRIKRLEEAVNELKKKVRKLK